MNNIKQSFGIRDLENLSGIKAHTIRIWEKRYDLLEPERTATNIRTYSLSSLQKLLNITLLYNHGMKISRIAQIPEGEIGRHVRNIVSESSAKSQAISAFKMAMINFDQVLFQKTFEGLSAEKPFSTIFREVFIPLLNELGLLWQTDTISPAHEHFITHLIKQKILTCTEKLQGREPVRGNATYVLYLPENEIHEIGLLYINFELLQRGNRTLYLGPSIPMENLKDVIGYVHNPVFISYFTVSPEKDKVADYLQRFRELFGADDPRELWILGHQTADLDPHANPESIRVFHSIDSLLQWP